MLGLEEQLLEQMGEPKPKRPRLSKKEKQQIWEDRKKEAEVRIAKEEPGGEVGVDDGWRWRAVKGTLKQRYTCQMQQGSGKRLVHGCFMKSSRWSPDGSVLLANSEDNVLRLYNLPETLRGEQPATPAPAPFTPVLTMTEGECIYDYTWYPKMSERSNSCFASSSRDHPIHLWDSLSGRLRATYRTYSDVGEVIAAYSLAFSPTGDKLVGGYRGSVRVFDSETAGEPQDVRPTTIKINRKRCGMSGVISTLCFSPTHGNIFAAGSFTSQYAVYDLRIPGKGVAMVNKAHCGGLTHMKFTPCGRYLATAARKDGTIKLWDLRLTGRTWSGEFRDAEVAEGHNMRREVPTNQRVTFDIDPSGTVLYSGCKSGGLRIYNLKDPSAECEVVPVTKHSLNGVHHHPTLPILSLTTGERSFKVKKDCSIKVKPVPFVCDISESETTTSSGSDSSSESSGDEAMLEPEPTASLAEETRDTVMEQAPEPVPEVLEIPKQVDDQAADGSPARAFSLSLSGVSDSIIDAEDPPREIPSPCSDEPSEAPAYPLSDSTLEIYAGVSETFRLFVPQQDQEEKKEEEKEEKKEENVAEGGEEEEKKEEGGSAPCQGKE